MYLAHIFTYETRILHKFTLTTVGRAGAYYTPGGWQCICTPPPQDINKSGGTSAHAAAKTRVSMVTTGTQGGR